MLIQADFVSERPGGRPLEVQFQANVKRGRLSFLAGPRGAGKTTLLRMLQGSLTPDRGRILGDGRLWFDGDGGRLMGEEERTVGAVFGDEPLSRHQTVQAVLSRALPGDHHDPTRARHVAGLLEQVGLARMARRKVMDLTPLESWWLCLGRVLATQPRLILLDEPFQGLDARGREDLAGALRGLAKAESVAILATYSGEEPLGQPGELVLTLEAGGTGRILSQG